MATSSYYILVLTRFDFATRNSEYNAEAVSNRISVGIS